MSKAIILSIHPKWAKLIYEGKKTIEWRKNIPTADFIDKVFTYDIVDESGPIVKVRAEVRLGVRMAKEGRGTCRTGRRHDERA